MFRLNYSVSPFSLQIDMDGRGLTAMQYKYDMLQTSTLQTSIDSGTQRTLVDAAGQLLFSWDAEDRKTEIIYDELRRPLKRITNDKELERYIYGEGLVNDKINNLRGQLYQHYDGSGLQQINIYDFKGNALETQQQLLDDATISDADWSSNPVLSVEVFTSAITYDALNRPITQTDPGGNVQAFTYDKGGLLKSIKLNNENYVNDIHYDAKGQRKAIWYGNGTKTSYTYDAFTFRLRRLLTVNLNTNDILQDLNYWFDPVGNITEIQDDAQQTLFFNNSVVAPTQKFVYDALYRLSEAKGRELIGTADFCNEDNWNDSSWKTSHKGDGSAVQNYIQQYTYDGVGNMLQLQHIAGTGSYTRTYEIDTNSNGLLSTEVGSNTYAYSHDERGNMTKMPHLDSMAWNTQNELKSILKGSEPTYYQYSGGERVRKHTVKGNIKEERIYLDSYEIYRKYVNNVLDIERTTVHVSDDTGRIAMLEVRTVGTDSSPEELTRYIYSNHLQSASLELDETGAIISYEEYHPYGTTSYQANNSGIKAVAKRYRYTGKERDEESGLYYHGARYYVPWLARWVSVDPINSENYNLQKGYGLEKNLERDFLELTASPYEYCYDNPINYNDLNGEQVNPLQMVEIEWNRLFNTAEKKITEAIDKSFEVALISVAYKKAPELLINDLFGTEMSEERKQEIFDTDFEASVGILLYEFATGTGEQHRDFYYSKDKPNSFANKVVEGYVFKDVVEGIYRRVLEEVINNDISWKNVEERNSFYGFGIEFSPDQTGLRIDKSIKRHIESNSAQFFLGGATVTAYPKGNISANVQIFNETSRSSLMLHLPKENYSIGPLHTISQTIHFKVVNLDPSKTVNFQPDFIDINLNKIKWLRNVLD